MTDSDVNYCHRGRRIEELVNESTLSFVFSLLLCFTHRNLPASGQVVCGIGS